MIVFFVAYPGICNVDLLYLPQQLQVSMAEQQKNMDYLNSTGDKFVKSLPRQKSEQLRTKLADLNDKWRDINLHAEKRQTQVRIL